MYKISPPNAALVWQDTEIKIKAKKNLFPRVGDKDRKADLQLLKGFLMTTLPKTLKKRSFSPDMPRETEFFTGYASHFTGHFRR